eukprot:g5818.t1
MHKYRLISKKGEGTFSEVLKAQSIKNGQYTAIKCMKNHFDSIEQVNNLREIQALQRLSPNPHVVKLYEVLYDQPTGRLALVFELMNMNMYELIRGRRHYLPENAVKLFMYQLMKAMDHMHRNGIFHRDIKPENILIRDDLLKVADFGSCRGIYSKQPYTEYISTRWYRAPECLLTDGYYGYKMDMWGVGCVMFEVIALFPLFPGTNELDQISKVHKVLGTPSPQLLEKFKEHAASHIDFHFPHYEPTGIAKMIPHVSTECVDLIEKLIDYDPDTRLSARQALRHPWFRELREAVKMVHRGERGRERGRRSKRARAKRERHRERERDRGGDGGAGGDRSDRRSERQSYERGGGGDAAGGGEKFTSSGSGVEKSKSSHRMAIAERSSVGGGDAAAGGGNRHIYHHHHPRTLPKINAKNAKVSPDKLKKGKEGGASGGLPDIKFEPSVGVKYSGRKGYERRRRKEGSKKEKNIGGGGGGNGSYGSGSHSYTHRKRSNKRRHGPTTMMKKTGGNSVAAMLDDNDYSYLQKQRMIRM